VRLGVFFAENPQNQPGAKVLKAFETKKSIVFKMALTRFCQMTAELYQL